MLTMLHFFFALENTQETNTCCQSWSLRDVFFTAYKSPHTIHIWSIVIILLYLRTVKGNDLNSERYFFTNVVMGNYDFLESHAFLNGFISYNLKAMFKWVHHVRSQSHFKCFGCLGFKFSVNIHSFLVQKVML